ncbi:MAG: Queuine tRNA-ribosyltransferase, partial [Candidatus Levybacteria bacterium GW2011_GWB1_41_21]
MKPKFEITKKDRKTNARAGVIKTPHGNILTPAFFPVGTKGTVKGLTPEQIKEIGVEAVLANTYHLHLRPGENIVSRLGGLAKFMNWNGPARNASANVAGGPTMTDSGGFQVFSLGVAMETGQAKLLREDVQEEGK